MKLLICGLLIALSACDKTRPITLGGENPSQNGTPHSFGPTPGGAASPGGGTDFGGGTDRGMRFRFAHWFPLKRNIEVCIRRADDFALSQEQLRITVGNVFDTWNGYLGDNNVELHGLRLNVSIAESCSLNTDVEFLFGVSDERVRNSRRRFYDPFGMALFQEGKGFIWVAPMQPNSPQSPDWKKAGHLTAVLLHEVGHVFGNDHVEGTVMAADLGESLDELPVKWLTQIDHSRQLLACTTCARGYRIKIEPELEGNDLVQIATLQRIAGTNETSPFTVRFDVQPNRKNENLALEINWRGGRRRLTSNLSEKLDLGVFLSGSKVFLVMGKDWSSSSFQYSSGYEFRNMWQSDDGKKYEIIYGLNMAQADQGDFDSTFPARLQLLHEGQRVTIVNFPSDSNDLESTRKTIQ